MTNFQKVVSTYRSQQDLSLREFAQTVGVSHQTVSNWEKGLQTPAPTEFILLAATNDGWVRDFALDAMAALNPEMYKPATTIGSPA